MERPVLAAMLSCRGYTLSDEEKRFFARSNPLGLNLFGRNIQNPRQLKQLIDDFKNCVGRDNVLIAVDQEGGRVRRLSEPHWQAYSAAAEIGSLPLPEAKEASKLQAALISHDLSSLGINLNYAPVLDLCHPQTSEVIRSRTFGSNELVVGTLGKAAVDEYITCHISPCIKHLPGHGRAAVDPHLELPVITEDLKTLEQDFAPFRQVNDAPSGMTAHIIVTAVDDKHPVTQSKKAIDVIIRGHIGFDGFLFSDAVDMHALRGSSGEKAAACLAAGCDGICYALGRYEEMLDIAEVCPPLTDKARQRLEKIVNIVKTPLTASASQTETMRRRYRELTGTIPAYTETYDATEVLNRIQQHKGEN